MTPLEATLFVVAALVVVLLLRRALGSRTFDVSRFAGVLAPFNALRFGVRRALRFSRGVPRLVNEPKDSLFAYLDADARARAHAREAQLREAYALGALAGCSSRAAYRENLYVLDVLDAHVPADALEVEAEDSRVVVVDVGSKDFVYASALAAFARRRAGGPIALVGVELDGHVIYRDLRSRADHARAHASLAGDGVHYEVADFLAYQPPSPASLVTMFFPFVTRFALLQWGLPAREYRPEALLAHAAQMLAPDGVLLVVNHTHEERAALATLVQGVATLEEIASARLEGSLVDYGEDVPERTVTTLRRLA